MFSGNAFSYSPWLEIKHQLQTGSSVSEDVVEAPGSNKYMQVSNVEHFHKDTSFDGEEWANCLLLANMQTGNIYNHKKIIHFH